MKTPFTLAGAVVVALLALSASAGEAPPPCSEEGMRYVEQQKQAHISELQQWLRTVNKNLKNGLGNRELLAKKKATSKEIGGLQSGKTRFVPTLPKVSEAQVGVVGRFPGGETMVTGAFNTAQNMFLVVRAIGPDTIEARQILFTTISSGFPPRQERGPDKIGSVAQFTGIDATGMEIGSEVRLTQIFDAVGKVESSGGGECLKFAVVTIPPPSAPAKKAASAKNGTDNNAAKLNARPQKGNGE